MHRRDEAQLAVRRHAIATRAGPVRVGDTGGGGPPLVMLHGSSFSGAVFERQVRSGLAGQARIVAIDFPGHGGSGDARDPHYAYSLPGLADCVEDVLGDLGIARAAFFGWSLGGHVAIELLARDRLVAGLMLTGAPPVPRGLVGMLRGFHPSFDLLLASRQDFSRKDIDRFVALCFGESADPSFADLAARADGLARSVFSRSMMRGEGADQRAAVERSDVPLAFVNGADDPFVRLGYLAGLDVRQLFGSRSIVLPDTGHAPFWERPDLFNPILGLFVQAVVERRPDERQDGASQTA